MTALILNGKALAEEQNVQTKNAVDLYQVKYGIAPSLSLIRVGENSDSQKYVKSKIKLAEKLGIKTKEFSLKEGTSLLDLKKLILDIKSSTDAILVQLPLPLDINTEEVLNFISPEKEVDGLHQFHLGAMFNKTFSTEDEIVPCTALGVLVLVEKARGVLGNTKSLSGLHSVICGRSKLVGLPTAMLLQKAGSTVSICHSQTTTSLRKQLLKSADVVVSAVGKPNFIHGDDIKEGAIVIDVGINYQEEILVGDVDFQSALSVAGAISPVPGGVGPLTLAMLMRNVVALANKNKNTNVQS